MRRAEAEKRRANAEYKTKSELGEGTDTRDKNSGKSIKPPRPRMPMFDTSMNSIDAYLALFESYADEYHFSDNDRCLWLGSVLSKDAQAVWSNLHGKGGVTYDKIKAELYICYGCTRDLLQQAFRAAPPTAGESMVSYAHDLTHKFERWLKMANCSEVDREACIGCDSLVELILQEQYLNSIAKDLQVHLREQDPSSLDEMARL